MKRKVRILLLASLVDDLCFEKDWFDMGKICDYEDMLKKCATCCKASDVEDIAICIASNSDFMGFILETNSKPEDFVNYIYYLLLNKCCVYVPVV